jgi:hypothetical protein
MWLASSARASSPSWPVPSDARRNCFQDISLLHVKAVHALHSRNHASLPHHIFVPAADTMRHHELRYRQPIIIWTD